MFLVYYWSADSYNSRPEMPIAAFDNEPDAIAFAKAQPGYGYGIDWKIKKVPFNPPIEEAKR